MPKDYMEATTHKMKIIMLYWQENIQELKTTEYKILGKFKRFY